MRSADSLSEEIPVQGPQALKCDLPVHKSPESIYTHVKQNYTSLFNVGKEQIIIN